MNLFKLPLTGILLLLYLTLLLCWFVIPEYTLFNSLFTSLLLLLTIIWGYLFRYQWWKYLKGSDFKKQFTLITSAFLYLLIVAIINYLAYRYNHQWDSTKDQLNTLSLESQKLVKSFPDPVKCLLFFRKKGDAPSPIPLLELYQNANKNFIVSQIDPDLHPDLVKKYGVRQNSSCVLQWKEKQINIVANSEVAISQGLLNLKRNKNPRLFWSIGHGEANLEEKGPEGYSYLGELLQNYKYQVEPFSFLSSTLPNPNDGVMVIWGPAEPFSSQEIDKLRHYLEQGGHLLLALNSDFVKDTFGPITQLLKKYEIELGNNLVIDKKMMIDGSEGTVPLAVPGQYSPQHPITEQFQAQTFYPVSRSIRLLWPTPSHFEVTPLVTSSEFPHSWAKNNKAAIRNHSWDFEGNDYKGPIVLAVAIKEQKEVEGRGHQKLVIWGTPQGLQNNYQQFSGNFNLFLNSLSWPLEEDFIMSSSRAALKSNPLYINQYELATIFYFSLIVGPLLLLLMALGFYFWRRKF